IAPAESSASLGASRKAVHEYLVAHGVEQIEVAGRARRQRGRLDQLDRAIAALTELEVQLTVGEVTVHLTAGRTRHVERPTVALRDRESGRRLLCRHRHRPIAAELGAVDEALDASVP